VCPSTERRRGQSGEERWVDGSWMGRRGGYIGGRLAVWVGTAGTRRDAVSGVYTIMAGRRGYWTDIDDN
jgi:hypothetical protein